MLGHETDGIGKTDGAGHNDEIGQDPFLDVHPG